MSKARQLLDNLSGTVNSNNNTNDKSVVCPHCGESINEVLDQNPEDKDTTTNPSMEESKSSLKQMYEKMEGKSKKGSSGSDDSNKSDLKGLLGSTNINDL